MRLFLFAPCCFPLLNGDFKLPNLFPTATDLLAEWQSNLEKQEQLSQEKVLDLLLKEVLLPTPSSCYALLELREYQWNKKRLFDVYYISLMVFVWFFALKKTHPNQADSLLRLFHFVYPKKTPKAKKTHSTIRRHLDYFLMVTDTFNEDGFMSAVHHVVQRVLGEIEQKPGNLIFSVALASHLDTVYETWVKKFEITDIRAF